MAEFESLLLSKYLVGIGLMRCKNDKSKASVMLESKSLYTKWKEYSRS